MSVILKPVQDIFRNQVDFQVVTCFMKFEEKILVLQRGRVDDQFGLWGIPGGKIDEDEKPREALSREIFEETGVVIPQKSFCFFDKALSENKFDGTYILYIYFFCLKNSPSILINNSEHLNFRWVTLEEFEALDLLISQSLAYRFVSKKIKKKWSEKK